MGGGKIAVEILWKRVGRAGRGSLKFQLASLLRPLLLLPRTRAHQPHVDAFRRHFSLIFSLLFFFSVQLELDKIPSLNRITD